MQKKRLTTLRFDDAQYQALDSIAAQRGMSISALVRSCVDAFLEGRGHTEELQEFEARLVASLERINKTSVRAGNDVQLLIAITDQLSKFLFSVTPEVIDTESAKVIGARRYKQFVRELSDSFSNNEKESSVSKTLKSKVE